MRGEKRFPRSLFALAEGVFIKKTASVEAGPLRSGPVLTVRFFTAKRPGREWPHITQVNTGQRRENE